MIGPAGVTRAAQALEYIHSLHRFGSRLGLSRPRRLLAALGDPHLGLQAIHVAGTNGKGSVAAMLASALTAAGYRTGLYISPYVTEFGERIQVDGRPITPDEVAKLVADVRPAAERLAASGDPEDQVTEFEFVTALGFLHFARSRVDFLVCEVGLGGRFDATNVIDRPLAAVITSVGLDHTDRLGPTLAAIAAEKAGIIKRAAPVVSAPQGPEVLAVLEATAARRGCPLYLAGRDGRVSLEAVSLSGQVVTFRGPGFPLVESLSLPLLGPHQLVNAATALTTLGALKERGRLGALDSRVLREGLARTVWPGRFEVFGDRPPIIIDGAHNPPGAEVLAASLRQLFPGRRLHLVLGLLGDKDVDAYLSLVLPPSLPGVVRLVACQPPNPRALGASNLAARLAARCPGLPVQAVPAVGDAVRLAFRDAGPADAVVVAGSLYQVGEARAAARELAGLGGRETALRD